MFLIVLAVLGLGAGAFVLAAIHAEGVSVWIQALPPRLRRRGWGLLLLPVAMAAAAMAGGAHGLIPAELGIAVLAIVFAPKLAAKLVPYGVLGLAVFGVHLAKLYRDGFTSQVHYLFIHAGPDTWDGGAAPVLAEAGILFVTGLWLLLRLDAPGARLVKVLAARWLNSGRGGISAVHGLLLVPVVGLAMQLLGPGNWFGFQAVDGLDVAVIDLTAATAALVLIFRSRAWAATLAEAGLLVLGAYGWLIAVFWPNAVRHSGARTVRIHLSHSAGTLRAQVTDDGAGGADPAAGSGLAGVERRLATFDGILALSSPPGGPTIVAIEVPCALSSRWSASCSAGTPAPGP